MRKWAPLLLVLLAGLLFAAGCGGGSDKPTKAQFRVINGVSDSVGYDILVDGSTFSTGVNYKGGTSYATIADGAHTIEVRNTGTSADILSQNFSVTAGSNYSFVVVGQGGVAGGLLLTDNSTAADSGKTKIRIVNGAQSFGAMDVYITPADTDIFTVSANVANLQFGSSADYQSFDDGTYEIRVTKPGEKSIVYFFSGSIDFASTSVVTYVFTSSGTLDFIKLPDAGSS